AARRLRSALGRGGLPRAHRAQARRPAIRRGRRSGYRGMKPLVGQDYYETLDVPRSANFEDIERAYRLACDTYCEDSLAGYPVFEIGDVELLRERIEVAYRILVDPETRRAYALESSSAQAEPLVPARSQEGGAASDEGARAPAPVLAPLDALDELEEGE